MDMIMACGFLAPIEPNLSYNLATGEDRDNNPDNSSGKRKKRSTSDHTKFWAQHRTLNIGFLKVEGKLVELIKSTIKLWTPHINLNIQFVENAELADIRISTSPDLAGDWSVIGTDALGVPKDEPTMHFDTSQPRTLSSWRVYVLHEFGHVLGLLHEHQHPDVDIDWNTHAVYKTYLEHTSLSKEQIFSNIFQKNKKTKEHAAPYDRKSIMHYGFPAELTWSNVAIPWNLELSEKDISFIRSIYPPNK